MSVKTCIKKMLIIICPNFFVKIWEGEREGELLLRFEYETTEL